MSRAGTDTTAGAILGAISVIAVFYSMSCLVNAKRFEREGRIFLRYLFLFGLLISEGYILLAEGAWFKEHFMVTAVRSQIEQIAAASNLAVVENAQQTVEDLKSKRFRSERAINSAIDKALSREVDIGHNAVSSLAKATKDCVDRSSTWYTQCGDVLALREELAISQQGRADFEQAKAVIGTRTLLDGAQISAPANAGAIFLSDIVPISLANANIVYIVIGLLLVACLRIGIGPVLIEPMLSGEKPEPGDVLAAVTLTPAGANDRGRAMIEADTPPAPMLPPSGPRPKKPALAEPSAAAAVFSNIAAVQAQERAFARPARILGSVEAFYADQTIKKEGAEHSAGDFWRTYLAWCREKGFAPVGEHTFRKESERFVSKGKFKRGALKNRAAYRNRMIIRLVPAAA